ncbi:cytochrome c oxidase assembly protein subunit 15 [Ferrimonas sediminum]|uniref:Cytochrome c oxidase assembly protein subunit 15 n=1 Tax=Ferrimonas sediminum TaxID=718193 RepID=A0A1G8ZN96_9GAMM|nr:COX15/CtaA family protein [Ferrimonas sediminum]SDK15630.1 cytochrome c oxidase assembly protein subunit 15 [Ferrimonas sediminum]
MNRLILATAALAFVVIVVGAFTRLTDAGLGCPDWPGCYGFLTPVEAKANEALALSRFPDRPLEMAKAWAEMGHRYIASLLGLMIVAIALLSWRTPQRGHGVMLLALVLFQGALGMWTVTLNLMPVVVMGHLLGGLTLLSLLGLLWMRRQPGEPDSQATGLAPLAAVALLALVLQVALGGWTSANYAAVVCTTLPVCEGNWWQQWDPVNAFRLIQPAASSYEFGTLDYGARMTIHVSHRLWALVTAALLLWLALRLVRRPELSRWGTAIAVLTLIQVGLGLANVVWQLPLAVAVAHNGGAALLVMTLVCTNYRVRSRLSATQRERVPC